MPASKWILEKAWEGRWIPLAEFETKQHARTRAWELRLEVWRVREV